MFLNISNQIGWLYLNHLESFSSQQIMCSASAFSRKGLTLTVPVCLLHTSPIGIKRPQSYDLLPYRSLSCHNCFVWTTIACSSRCDGCVSKIELVIAQTFKTSFNRLKCYALVKHIFGLEGQAFFCQTNKYCEQEPIATKLNIRWSFEQVICLESQIATDKYQ